MELTVKQALNELKQLFLIPFVCRFPDIYNVVLVNFPWLAVKIVEGEPTILLVWKVLPVCTSDVYFRYVFSSLKSRILRGKTHTRQHRNGYIWIIGIVLPSGFKYGSTFHFLFNILYIHISHNKYNFKKPHHRSVLDRFRIK